jgi:hypothetical protein
MSLAARFGWPVGRAGYECRANDRCVAARTSVSSADEVLELLLRRADPAGSASVGLRRRVVLELLLGVADPAGSASVAFSCGRSAG